MAQAGSSTAALRREPTVGVRYVGRAAEKKDTLLYRRDLVWRRGEVKAVPVSDARRYLNHPMVWVPEDQPWDAAAVAPGLADGPLAQAVRAGDLAVLERHEPAAMARLRAQMQPVTSGGHSAPLDATDAQQLVTFVPHLVAALLNGNQRAVQRQLELAEPLLRAFAPLLEASIEAERSGMARDMVLGQLADMQQPDRQERLLIEDTPGPTKAPADA